MDRRQWKDFSAPGGKLPSPHLRTEPATAVGRGESSAMPKSTSRQWVDLAAHAVNKPRTGVVDADRAGHRTQDGIQAGKRDRSERRRRKQDRKIERASERLQEQIEAEEDAQREEFQGQEGEEEREEEEEEEPRTRTKSKSHGRRSSRSRSSRSRSSRSRSSRSRPSRDADDDDGDLSARATSPNRLQQALEERANELEKEFLNEVGKEETEFQRLAEQTGTPLEAEEIDARDIGADDELAGEHDDFLDGRRDSHGFGNIGEGEEDANWENVVKGPKGRTNPIAERVLRQIAGMGEKPERQDRVEDFYSLDSAKRNIKSAAFAAPPSPPSSSATAFDPFLECQDEELPQDDDAETSIDWIKMIDRPERTDEAQCWNKQLADRIKYGMASGQRGPPQEMMSALGCGCPPDACSCGGMTRSPPAFRAPPPQAMLNVLGCGCPPDACSCNGNGNADMTASDLLLAREVDACGDMINTCTAPGVQQSCAMPSAQSCAMPGAQSCASPRTRQPCAPSHLRSPCSSDFEFDSDDGQYLGDDEEIRCMQRDMRQGMRADARAIRRIDPEQVQSAGAISGMVMQAQKAIAQANELLKADPDNARAKLQLEVAQSMLQRAGPAAQAAFQHALSCEDDDSGDLDAKLEQMGDAELEQHAAQVERRSEKAAREERRQLIAQKAHEQLNQVLAASASKNGFVKDPAMDTKIADKVVGIAKPTGADGKPLSRYEMLRLRVEKAKKRAQDAREAANKAHTDALAQAAQAKADAVEAAKQAGEARMNKARQDLVAAQERFDSLTHSEADALSALTAAKTELEHLQGSLSEQEQELAAAQAAQQKTLSGGLTFDDLMAFDSDCETDELDDQLSQLATASTSVGPPDAFRISQALHRSLNISPGIVREQARGPLVDFESNCCPPTQEAEKVAEVKEEEGEGERDVCDEIDMDRPGARGFQGGEGGGARGAAGQRARGPRGDEGEPGRGRGYPRAGPVPHRGREGTGQGAPLRPGRARPSQGGACLRPDRLRSCRRRVRQAGRGSGRGKKNARA